MQKKPGFCAIKSIAATGEKPGFLPKNFIKYALS
jgi:hypothetical protein